MAPRLAGSPAVPQPVELLEPAFTLRPRPLRFRWAHTQFAGEVSEQLYEEFLKTEQAEKVPLSREKDNIFVQ